ncbi:cyanophycinase, partial [Thermaurantiacus sp.]
MVLVLLSVAGALVIAGGALGDDGAVIRAVLDRRPAGAPAVAVIAAASAEPATALARARDQFVRHGADPQHVRLIRLAAHDDPATPEDEAGWAENARSPAETGRLADAGAIWFTGGDQAVLAGLLREAGGADTPMLAAIRARHRAGAVVGGTSAGAAAMPDPMLAGGDPLAAAAAGRAAGRFVTLAPGLGLLTRGLVDQHFDARDRLPRLVAALMALPAGARVGYGIDEGTALVVEGARLSVVGRGLVTVVDARR